MRNWIRSATIGFIGVLSGATSPTAVHAAAAPTPASYDVQWACTTGTPASATVTFSSTSPKISADVDAITLTYGSVTFTSSDFASYFIDVVGPLSSDPSVDNISIIRDFNVFSTNPGSGAVRPPDGVSENRFSYDSDTCRVQSFHASHPLANAPTNLIANVGDRQVSVTFTAPSDNGGAAISDYEYELDGSGTWTSASTDTTPVVIAGLTNGAAYSIKLRAVNSAGAGAESAAVVVTTPSPASAFEESEVRKVITSAAQRSLQSTVTSNQRMTQDARSRFIASQRQQSEGDAGISSRNNVALDLDGFARIDGAEFTAKSSFFEQTGNFEGTQRRLFFGDFDVQRDESGSTTGSFNGKVAWERNISETAMLGYYLGGTLGKSQLKGTFEGTQSQYGASVGAYVVAQINDALFVDGFASLGAARNSLEMDNGTLALTSDYVTRTATVGGALTGIIKQEGFEIRPELAFSYGKTSIGNVDFTGSAYNLTDDTLNLNAGTVSIASLTFRPEFYVPISESAGLGTNAMFTFAPRLICERVITDATTQNCGRGGEIGVSSKSDDGLTDLSVSYKVDYIGDSKRSGLLLNLSHKF